MTIDSHPSSNGSLSIVGRLAAVQPPAMPLKTRVLVRGGPASYMGYPLPRAPGSVGRKPCGQGSPPLQPDGAGQYGRVKAVDEGDDDDVEDDEDLNSSSSDRWVPRSGPPGCVVCALGPLGLGRLWFPSQGTASGILGLPPLFPGLPLILESI
jgi:hypothetical protein